MKTTNLFVQQQKGQSIWHWTIFQYLESVLLLNTGLKYGPKTVHSDNHMCYLCKWQSYLSQQSAGRCSFPLWPVTPSQMNCWSASPPLSAAGAQKGSPHIAETARYTGKTHSHFVLSMGWNQFTQLILREFFSYRTGASGGRMQYGITHWDARNTNTFWKIQQY